MVEDFVRGEGEAPPVKKRGAGPLGRRRDQLRVKVSAFEAELAELHGRITSGVRGECSGTPEQWIQRARELREGLHRLRLELIRVERRIAREQRLAPAADPSPELRTAVAAPGKDRDDTARSRQSAVDRALQRHGPGSPETRETLRRVGEALLHSEPDVRRRAVVRLGEIESPARGPLLRVAVEDDFDRVRLSALHVLLKTEGGPPILLLQLADDPAPFVRAAALTGLSRQRPRAATPVAIKALEDRAPEVRRSAAAILGQCSPDEAIAPLVLALGDDDEAVCMAAINALGAFADDRTVLALIRVLDDPSEVVREAGARALKTTVGTEIEIAAQALDPAGIVHGLADWWLLARAELGVTRALRAAGVALDASSFEELLGDESRGHRSVLAADKASATRRSQDSTPPARKERTLAPKATAPRADELEDEPRVRAATKAAAGRDENARDEVPEVVAEKAEVAKAAEPRAEEPQAEEPQAEAAAEEGGDFESLGGDDGDEGGDFESLGGDDDGDEGGDFESLGGDDDGDEGGDFESLGSDDDGDEGGDFESLGGDDDG
ncbi:MAG: hypothetical protein DRJ42_23320, partial [Deltaproteobacteria bacterium]